MVKSVGYGMRRRCASGNSGIVRASETVLHRDVSGSNVGYHLGYEEGAKTWCAISFYIGFNFIHESDDPTNTGSPDDPGFVGVQCFQVQSGILDCLLSRTHGVLSKQVHFSYLFTIKVFCKIKILYLASKFSLEIGGVKSSNGSGSAYSLNQVFPVGLYRVAQRSNRSNSRYNYSF